MLNAILRSKSGRLQPDRETSLRWRDVFKDSEDLVTSTVFERLSYLPPEKAWKIICDAAAGQLLSYKMADLLAIEYWPMWEHAERSRGVEPDIFLALELGDPAKKFHVIVETKHRTVQWVEQWIDELNAWAYMVAKEALPLPDALIFIAIEGNNKGRRRQTEEEFHQAVKNLALGIESVSLVLMGWEDIARACATFSPMSKANQRIVSDMVSGLELCGYYHLVMPRQLERVWLNGPAIKLFDVGVLNSVKS